MRSYAAVQNWFCAFLIEYCMFYFLNVVGLTVRSHPRRRELRSGRKSFIFNVRGPFWTMRASRRVEIRGTYKLTPVPNVLLWFPGWTICFLETVCNGVWDTFSLVWWVCQKCQPNQQQSVYKPRGIKEIAAQWVQVKSFNVSAEALYTQQLKILEDMFVLRVL